jgi:hypothetical protein
VCVIPLPDATFRAHSTALRSVSWSGQPDLRASSSSEYSRQAVRDHLFSRRLSRDPANRETGDTRFDEMRSHFWQFAGFWVGQILWVWVVCECFLSDWTRRCAARRINHG